MYMYMIVVHTSFSQQYTEDKRRVLVLAFGTADYYRRQPALVVRTTCITN